MHPPLSAIGWTADREAELTLLGRTDLEPARVARVDRGLVTLLAADGEHRRPSAVPGLAVGDWVAFAPGGRIEHLLPRRTALVRSTADTTRHHRAEDERVVAANVDLVLAVRALDMALRVGRVQALLALAWASGATPGFILTKADRAEDPSAAVDEVAAVAPGIDVRAVSALTGQGMEALRALIGDRTIVLLGESGAGKSTLVNALAGGEVLATADVTRTGTGRHATTHRQLVLLPGGGAVIDTPGVREAGYLGDREGVALAYADVEDLAARCRFGDCRHEGEPGCAVRAAIDDGVLAQERLDAYRRTRREQAALERRGDPVGRRSEMKRVKARARSFRKDAWS